MESFKTFYCISLYLLASFHTIYAGNGYISIVDQYNYELTGDPRTYTCSNNVQLECKYLNDNAYGKVIRWIHFTSDGGTEILTGLAVGTDRVPKVLILSPHSSGHYACEYERTPDSRITITISLAQQSAGIRGCQDDTPVSTTPIVTSSSSVVKVTPSSVAIVTTTSSPTTYTNTTHFVGLNPLIYTTITAILLVVLTLVAIVTCWLRSRKMSSQRTLLPQETPQDYLDYIREGQFTPLTTSEFLASLHERPPTYVESQDIQHRLDETPPPLPQRNTTSPTESRNATPTSPLSVVQEVTLQDPSIDTPEYLMDDITLQDPSIDTTLQDPLAPLLDPIFLQDPPQSNEIDDATLINIFPTGF